MSPVRVHMIVVNNLFQSFSCRMWLILNINHNILHHIDANIIQLPFCLLIMLEVATVTKGGRGLSLFVEISVGRIPAHFFGGRHVYCSLGHCPLILAMTLTLLSRSNCESIFHLNGFSLILYNGDFGQTCRKTS